MEKPIYGMGAIKTLIVLVMLLVVIVIGLPICIHILNEPYEGVQSSSTSTYQSNNNINYQSVTPTSQQSNTNDIEKVPFFHWQENIYPNSYWSIPVKLNYKERLEIKYICYSSTDSMWMDSSNFKLFKNGNRYRCYTLDPNGSDEWGFIEADYQDTWYLVFNNDTDHIKIVNVELRK